MQLLKEDVRVRESDRRGLESLSEPFAFETRFRTAKQTVFQFEGKEKESEGNRSSGEGSCIPAKISRRPARRASVGYLGFLPGPFGVFESSLSARVRCAEVLFSVVDGGQRGRRMVRYRGGSVTSLTTRRRLMGLAFSDSGDRGVPTCGMPKAAQKQSGIVSSVLYCSGNGSAIYRTRAQQNRNTRKTIIRGFFRKEHFDQGSQKTSYQLNGIACRITSSFYLRSLVAAAC